MYINPTSAPFSIPFFSILDTLIMLPINMLIAVIPITTGFILSSVNCVVVRIIEKIINAIIEIITDITLPFITFTTLLLGFSPVSFVFFFAKPVIFLLKILSIFFFAKFAFWINCRHKIHSVLLHKKSILI